jgi:glycerophosphoryl diester phosphodiesterase
MAPARSSLLIAAIVLAAHASVDSATSPKALIAHRGASAYRPEHTAGAYRLAIEQHADFVEPDLAVTKDRVLVCLHDDTLERTTNVADVYPDRFSRDQTIPSPGKHWVANDFTIEEIKRLDAGGWFGPSFAGEGVVTWQEAIDLVRGKAGLYPELKSPGLYQSRGVDMERLFVESVHKNGLDRPDSLRKTPLIIQSFDEATVRRIAVDLRAIPRVWLVEASDGATLTDTRLREIAGFATGIGPEKTIVDRDPSLVARAHAAGLTVTCWTFRADQPGRFATVRDEMDHFLYTLGIDALFTNNPDQFPRRR